MKEALYRGSMQHVKSGERVTLMVWATSVEEATHKVTGAIGGYRGEYRWTGSGPEYENNRMIIREI